MVGWRLGGAPQRQVLNVVAAPASPAPCPALMLRFAGGSVAHGFPEPPPPPPPPRPPGVHDLSDAMAQLQLGGQAQQPAVPPPPPPPPGLAPGAPLPGAPAAQQPAAFSLQQLWQAIEPDVAAEAARLAELERVAAAEAAAVVAARNERRVAKKAAQRAQQEAKRAERQRLRAERGRSRSRSRSRSSRGVGSRSRSATRSTSMSGSIAAAAAAAVSNLGRASSLAATVNSSSLAASSVADSSLAGGSTSVAAAQHGDGAGAPLTQAAMAALDDAAFTAAADALSCSSDAEPATEPAVAPVGRAAGVRAGLSDGSGSGGSGSGRRKERRFGKQQKEAARCVRGAGCATGRGGLLAQPSLPASLLASKGSCNLSRKTQPRAPAPCHAGNARIGVGQQAETAEGPAEALQPRS